MKKGRLVKCKPKFNHFTKTLMMNSAGFPDFICIKKEKKLYNVIGVEVKANGWLDKTEKEKCRFLLDKGIFNKILIAKKGKTRGEIEYTDFAEKYNKV